MAIPAKCECGFTVSAKDSYAGKKVKCPRCQRALSIPAKAAVGAAAGPQVNKKLLDLLDDVGVKSTPKGPICAACGSEMDPNAVICIECGYNVATGQYLETYTDDEDDDDLVTSDMSAGERAMAKAEREIEDSPIGADDQDFGDGADSYIVAMAGFAIFAVLILLGLGVVLVMESVTEDINTGLISAVASTVMYFGCAMWLTMVAFKSQAGHAIACLATVGLYCPIYGFMRGSGTIAIAIIMAASFLVGAASWGYCVWTGVFS